MTRRPALAGAALVLLTPVAAAAAPTQAQISAIRQACPTDYRQLCASVPTGGEAALRCLVQHQASLSPGCASAVQAASGTQAAAPAEPATEAAAGATSAVEDTPWPHTIESQGASVTIFQPQVLAWPGRTRLSVRAAVSITPAGAATPFLGTIDLTADTTTDPDTRDVTLTHLTLTGTQFPTLPTSRAAEVEQRLRAAIAALPPKHYPLDTILLSPGLKEAAPAPAQVANTPPEILARAAPASLLVFDGPPVLVPVGRSRVQRAVNTNWTVLRDGATGPVFLLANGAWYQAEDAAAGPYRPTITLPASFRTLPDDPALAEARQAIPPRPASPPAEIIATTKPAELIVTDGPPRLTAIPGTRLSAVTNTASTLIRDTGGTWYFLASGRWFSAPALTGAWTYATDRLPPDFAAIPPEGHEAVLAAVPGTAQAQAAVLQAAIPHPTTVARSRILTVSYAGPPRFVPIAGTSLQRSVNSPYGVIRAGGAYYVCAEAIWWTARSPTGPFVPATSIPAAIATIPPTDPLYPVTYVTIVSTTPAAVTYAYTAGYTLGFVSAGVLVYGTGYYYPPVILPGPVPVYFHYPLPYAGGVIYNPATGAWARGGAIYGPYGGARWGTAYNPETGAWARGGAIYGPNGGVAGFNAYNPSTGSYAHGSASWGPYGGSANASFTNANTGVSGSTHQEFGPNGRSGSSTFTGANQTVHTASGASSRGRAAGFSSSTGAEGAVAHGRNGNTAGIGKTASGTVYAGANGNVYKHTDDGWSKWNNGSWNPVQKSNTSGWQNEQHRLDQDRYARDAGNSWGQARGNSGGGRFGGGGSGGGRFRR